MRHDRSLSAALRLALLASLVAWPAAAIPDEPSDEATAAATFHLDELTLGLSGTDTKDDDSLLGEYRVLDRGVRPLVGIRASGGGENFLFSLRGDHRAPDDQSWGARLYAGGMLKAEATFDRLRHLLGHDPLAYGVEVQGLPPIRKVYKRDDEPGARYQITRSLEQARFELTPPSLSALTVHGSVRNEHRDGRRQAVAFGMCQTCHITSRGAEVDQTTREYQTGATLRFGSTTARYNFRYRDFEEAATSPENFYGGPGWNPDPALFATWPAAPASYAAKRLYNDETLPYSLLPGNRKLAHVLKTTTRLSKASVLSFDGVASSTENQYSGATLRYTSGQALLTTEVGKRLKLGASYRFQGIDNDDVLETKLATLAELMDTSDPYYPTEENLIDSALSRSTNEMAVTASYRAPRSGLWSLKSTYATTDYDHFLDEETRDWRTSLGWSPPPWKHGRLRIDYLAGFTSNPFVNPNAGKEGPPDPSYSGAIYSTFARFTREDPLGSDPTDRHELKVRWSGSASETLSYSVGTALRRHENDDTGWISEEVDPIADLTYSPRPDTLVNLSYSYQRRRVETLFSAPDMLLKAGQLAYHHGSFYRLVPYDEDAHAVSAFARRSIGKRLTLEGSLNFLDAKADFDTSLYVGQPDHGESTEVIDLRDLDQFSGQNLRQIWVELGGEYELRDRLALTFRAAVADLDDRGSHLNDLSGSATMLIVGVRLREP